MSRLTALLRLAGMPQCAVKTHAMHQHAVKIHAMPQYAVKIHAIPRSAAEIHVMPHCAVEACWRAVPYYVHVTPCGSIPDALVCSSRLVGMQCRPLQCWAM